MADPIERVASAVSDGILVDWVREKTRRPEHIDSLEQLSVLERIAHVHESAGLAGDSTEPAIADEPPGAREGAGVEQALFQWGHLEVLEKIGEGGGGEVYRAHDPVLKADVALKLLRHDYADSAQLTQRFLDEARRMARVRHPNVLAVHGADQHDGRAGIWAEYLVGRSLEDVIAQQGRMSACEAAVIGLDLCRALSAVHAAGLVHRDVKTTNVMREEGGRIVLMDFGSVAESPLRGASAWAAGVQGTPLCMAPEQLRGEVAGPPTDVYGLGVLLYRLVTRKYPIDATSLSELSEKHRRGEQIRLRDRRSDLPLEFVQVVEDALNPSPGERYQSAGEMELELALTLGTLARREVRRRRAWNVAMAGIAGFALIVGGFTAYERLSHRLTSPGSTNVPGVAAPPALAPLTATAQLVRRVGVHEEPLEPGSRIAPDDDLSLIIRGTDSMYVYVLNEDAAGEVNGLYPIKGLVPANPMGAGVPHRLPGDLGDQVVYWNVTSSGGNESIVAIASRAPLQDLEDAMKGVPAARRGYPVQFAKLNPMALRDLRGIGGTKTLPPPVGEAKRRLDAAIQALKEEGEKTGDVWVWSIELRNP